MDQEEHTEVVTGAPAARVADSYGFNPHEHKPSQDAFDPETADEKQAETGGVDVSAGNSSSTSEPIEQNSPEKSESSDSEPARTTENRTGKAKTAGSSARSMATNQKDS